MVLLPCSECANQISENAASCPKCGAPKAPQAVPAQEQKSGVLKFVGFVVAGFVAIGLLGSLLKQPEGAGKVYAAMSPLAIGKVRESELRQVKNKTGDGFYIYIKRDGLAPNCLWLYLDGKAYCMNGTARGFTPGLPFAGVPDLDPDEMKKRGIASTVDLLARFYGD